MFDLFEMVGSQQHHNEQTVPGWPRTFIHIHDIHSHAHVQQAGTPIQDYYMCWNLEQ